MFGLLSVPIRPYLRSTYAFEGPEMSELKHRIIEILQQPQLAALATVINEGKPWVRYVICLGQDDMTIRFATFANSRKVAQIKDNPEVHLTCGVTDPADMRPYL